MSDLKKFFSLVLFIFYLEPFRIEAQKTNIFYKYENTDAINDLREILSAKSAGTINILKVPLESKTGQEFYLYSQGGITEIKFTTDNSLKNAVYTLLSEWGINWYGPSDYWRVNKFKKKDIEGGWREPRFTNRITFGTGGVQNIVPGYDVYFYQNKWNKWKDRLRISAQRPVTSHAGSAFYNSKQTILDKNPKWFNSENGKRAGRIRIEFPEAVRVYKAWVKDQYEKQKDQAFITLGVDPEDGRGGDDDPLPPDGFAGIKKWNHADKWWWLANEVAKDYLHDPRVIVQMYAYGDGPTNALVPKIDLVKNLQVVMVPYAFQKAYMPDEMIRAWGTKVAGNAYVYDYWNITQWSLGLPQFNMYHTSEKLKLWQKYRINSVIVESTDAFGPINWWVMANLMFDSEKSVQQLFDQWLSDCFPNAKAPLKRMYERWALNYQNSGEVSLSLADILEADKLVQKGTDEYKRLNDLKAYWLYMKLFYNHDKTQRSKDNIFRYLFSIHPRQIVQVPAFVGQWYIPPFDNGNITPVDRIPAASFADIDQRFLAERGSVSEPYYVSDFKFDYKKALFKTAVDNNSWRFGRNAYAYIIPRNPKLKFEAGATEIVELSILSNDGLLLKETIDSRSFVYKESVDNRSYYMKKFELSVIPGKKYEFLLRGTFNRLKVIGNEILYTDGVGADRFDNAGYPLHYIYIPKSMKGHKLIVSDPTAYQYKLPTIGISDVGTRWNENNKIYHGKALEGMPGLFEILVRPEWVGKVIQINAGYPGWSFLNIDFVTSLNPFDYRE